MVNGMGIRGAAGKRRSPSSLWDWACCCRAACSRPSSPPRTLTSRRATASCWPIRPTRRPNSRAVSAPHRRLPSQGSAGHHRGRSGCALPLLRARSGQGDPLRRDRRRRGVGVLRRRQGRPQGRVAVLDADRRHQEAAHRHSRFRRPRPAQSARLARPLSLLGQPATRCTAFTAPTSRNISARRSRPAASA